MNITKKINVNFSSLIGLKAELLRKQTEVNEAKLKTEPVNVLPQLNKKKNKRTIGNTEKITKDTVDPEDIITHKKSKLMLEAKARLYERLKKSKNNHDKFLVDFKNKLDESDEELVDEEICKEHPIEPEENWVEYQDCFGRTRKCLREDLSHMQRKDDFIKQEIMKRNIDDTKNEENNEQYSTIPEKQPEIEIMRQRWETQTQKLADKVDIHYQDILFDEARAHGVGYYAFSQDEEERTKQQENLATLRKETKKKQKEMKEIKELKDKMEQNRLKAARIRQRIRAGLPAEPTEKEIGQEDKLISLTTTTDNDKRDNNESDEKSKESSEKADESIIIEERNVSNEEATNDEDKIKAFGELLGKKNHWHIMSQEEWIHKCREQRTSEFAPSYDNFTSAGFYNSNQGTDEQSTHKDGKRLDDIETLNFQKTITDSNIDLEKHQNDVTCISDVKSVSITDGNNSADYQNTRNMCNVNREPSRNITEPLLNSAKSSCNSLSLQKQATVSYPLSHLSSRYCQDRYNHLGAHTSDQHNLPNDMDDIPLPDESDILTTLDNNSTHTQDTSQRDINEDRIMAGLKYLREKFEESHSK